MYWWATPKEELILVKATKYWLKSCNSLANGISPMYCCGEVLEERNAGNHFDVVKEQLDK
jgi:triosephosphate isomerase